MPLYASDYGFSIEGQLPGPSGASINLNCKIAIFQGHTDVAPVADWTGTIAGYWRANASAISLQDIQDMVADLDADGFHRIGGGAAGCFTVRYAATPSDEADAEG